MSANQSSSSLPRGGAPPPPQQQQQSFPQPQMQPATGAPLYTSNEFQGVPMAYRQDDGSETPAPVMDSSHRRAYYPPTATASGEPHQQASSTGPRAALASPSSKKSSVQHDSTSPSAPPAARAASPTSPAQLPGRGDTHYGGPAAAQARPPSPKDSKGSSNVQSESNKSHEQGNSKVNEAQSENSAGVTYDSVVKPIFSPFQEFRAHQQEEEQQPQEDERYDQNQYKPHPQYVPPPQQQVPYAQPYPQQQYLQYPPPISQQQQQQEQQFGSHYSARPMGEMSPQASSYYAPPSTYALSYAQPQYSQPGSAYMPSSSYMTSSIIVPNTTVATGMESQSQLYYQQQQQQQVLDQQPISAEAAAAALEAQRLAESPDWNTGLFGLIIDPCSSIDSFLCAYCISSAHFNVMYREEQGMFVPMIAALLCLDCCCASETLPYAYPWGALAIHTFVIRREVRRRYGIAGNPFIVKNASGEGGSAPAQDVTVVTGDGSGVAGEARAGDAQEGTSSEAHPDHREEASAEEGRASPREGEESMPATVTSRNSNHTVNVDASTTAMDPPVKPHLSTDATSPSTTTSQTNQNEAANAAAPVQTATAASAEGGSAGDAAVSGGPAAPSTETVVVQSATTRVSSLSCLQNVNWLELGADALISIFCTPCAIAQHHREMSLRGEWPGKVVFSRVCFCGAREQMPAVVPAVSMF